MKIITFDGRLGRNAEVKVSKNGKKFLSFTVANNSFSEGQQRVDWFDVVCFDQYLVDRFTDDNGEVRLLKKGAYVIITGTINSVVNTGNNGNMYINHNVNAITIDKPNVGMSGEYQQHKATDDEDEPVMSVYTATTMTKKTEPTEVPKYVPSYNGSDFDTEGDLPF